MQRYRNALLPALIAVLAFALLEAGSQAHAAPAPISESRYIPVGGIEQWITIKGRDRANPVLLVLHGGPGNAWSPFADAMFADWDREFTLVQWDQRGAGRTFGKSGPGIANTMTVEQMVQDGIEVASYLRGHLGHDRVFLAGGSWGATLGLQMVQSRPDLFHAMVGFSPLINVRASMTVGYGKVLQMARAAGDQPAIDALSALGTPPWDSLRKWPIYRKWLRSYQAKLVTAPAAPRVVASDYASAQEGALNEEADEFSFIHFWGMTMSGPLMQVDLARLSPTYNVPVHLVAGAEDLTAPPELAKAFLDAIIAPRKHLHVLPGTGHEPSAPQLDLVHKILLEEAGHLARTRQ